MPLVALSGIAGLAAGLTLAKDVVAFFALSTDGARAAVLAGLAIGLFHVVEGIPNPF
jgi:hypothetical protein